MEVVQLKKGGKVKRRRAKPKQPLQTQRQTVNIRMGGGGGGGAMIGSTHTFSQPPQFYHAIREIPNQSVDYGNNPIRGAIPNQEPVAPTSVVSNPPINAPIQLVPTKTTQKLAPHTPSRGRGQGFPKLSLTLPRKPIASSPSSPPSPSAIASALPHDYYRAAMPEVGAVSAQASSSASAAALGAQLPKVVSPRRGRPIREAGAPTAPYRRTAPYPTGASWYDARGLPTPNQSVFAKP